MCGANFANQSYVHRHTKTAHNKCCCKKNIKDGVHADIKNCKKCAKSIMRLICMNEHKTKFGEWTQCGKIFQSAQALNIHIKKHESRFC